jgi:hypothetical protein
MTDTFLRRQVALAICWDPDNAVSLATAIAIKVSAILPFAIATLPGHRYLLVCTVVASL